MTSKSRLGLGLGALFPDQPIARPMPTPKPAKPLGDDGTPKSEEAKQGSGKERSHGAGSDKPLNKTVESQNVSRETSASTTSRRRRVPSLDALVHPSDMFFGQNATASPHVTAGEKPGGAKSGQDDQERSAGIPDEESATMAGHADENRDEVHDARHRAGLDSTSSVEKDKNNLKPVAGAYLEELGISRIVTNPHQPRTVFDEDELMELADSIRQVGVLQPIVVRHLASSDDSPQASKDDDDRYELIMGERRLRAAGLAGLTTIPAIIRTTSDDQMLRDALLENLHRVELNPVEQAAAFQQMMEEFGLTQAELSRSVSLSRPQIANTLRLLKLPGSIQKQVAAGVISAGHARALLSLSSTEDMEALAKRIVAEGLSVRSTEEIVMLKASGKKPVSRSTRSSLWENSPVRQRLENRFDTKVSITGSASRGKIHIVFSSKEDMQRILGLLDPDSPVSDSTQEWS